VSAYHLSCHRTISLSAVNLHFTCNVCIEYGSATHKTSFYSNSSDKLTTNITADHGLFNRIHQVAPICTPSNTRFLGLTYVCHPKGNLTVHPFLLSSPWGWLRSTVVDLWSVVGELSHPALELQLMADHYYE